MDELESNLEKRRAKMKNFQELWQDAEWRARVNEWTRTELARQNIRVQGELEETQVRPWSIVLYTTTDQGKIYFKAPPPGSRYETAVTEKLAEWFPRPRAPSSGGGTRARMVVGAGWGRIHSRPGQGDA